MKKATIIILIFFLIIFIAGILIFRKATWRDEKRAPELYYCALDEFSKGKTENALEKIEILMKKYKSKTWQKRWNFLSAYWELELGRASEAAKHFDRTYSEGEPLSGYALAYSARASLKAGKRSEAERKLLALLQKNQTERFFLDSLFLIADSRIESGNHAGARKILLQYKSRMKDDSVLILLLRLASILEKEDEKEKALKMYKEIYCLYPLSVESQEAEKHLGMKGSSVRIWDTNDIPILLKRGESLENASNYDDAFDLYTFMKKLFPERMNTSDMDLRAGRVLYNRRKLAEALTFLDKAKQDRAHAAEAIFYIARIDLRRGRDHRFVSAMKGLSENERGKDIGRRATLALAEYYDAHGEWGDAFPFYMKSLSFGRPGEKSEKAQWRAACILYLKGRYQDSYAQLNRIIAEKDNPYLVPATFWAGKCQEKLRNVSAAEELYSEVMRRAERNYYGMKARERLIILDRRSWITEKKDRPAKEREENEFPSLQKDFHAAEELLTMDLKDLAFEHLQYACGERAGNDGAPLVRSAEMAVKNGARQTAVDFLKMAMTLPSMPSIPDELLKLLYPRERADEICPIARSFSLDCNLILSLILQESAFNSFAVSRAGAIGLMQIMPETGEEVARKLGKKEYRESLLFKTDCNIQIGCSHLARLMNKFNGSFELSLAAYNAGEANVEKWKRWFPSNEIELFVDNIPLFETRNYVKRVVSNYAQYRELYGK